MVDRLSVVAGAVLAGAVIVPVSQRRSTTYLYVNDALALPAVLWECDGKVMFHSRSNISPWHGDFTHRQGKIEIFFSWNGVEPYKKVLVHYGGRDNLNRKVYDGWDYAGRRITMTQLGSTIWNPSTETWIAAPITD